MRNQADILAKVNKHAYANPTVVDWYNDLDFIHKPEAIILQRLTPLIKDKKLLDIGIGGGRTSKLYLHSRLPAQALQYEEA